jgi:Asp-tRNA(Asn)/Glu-tRNA(Gln) amidotransferase A subunit family amidase
MRATPTTRTDLADLSAIDARNRMIRGELKAVDLTESLLERIAAREPEIQAFAFHEPDMARRRAMELDLYRGSGRALGTLHGLSVGVKDIIDTADMPTENGTPIDAGRRPSQDAALVRSLRAAGAIIMGKTVTTEFANAHPAKTRNPRNAAHTPGGSSSGSAAAVAAGMVPLAVGTQTFGSVIRPASFCGVVGFKPTHGLIPRTGVHLVSMPLDTVGVFARTVADAALLGDALVGHDVADPDTRLSPPPRLLETALTEPPVTPEFAFVETPAVEEADPATREGLGEIVEALGNSCVKVTLPDSFERWPAVHQALMRAGTARNLDRYYRKAPDLISPVVRTAIEEGFNVSAVAYLEALDWREAFNNGLEQLFDRYDAILTPAAPGEAPRSLDTTGNPIFNGLWTLCGVPAITLPLLEGPNGLPVGVQLVGRRGEDARLLRTARWLVGALATA